MNGLHAQIALAFAQKNTLYIEDQHARYSPLASILVSHEYSQDPKTIRFNSAFLQEIKKTWVKKGDDFNPVPVATRLGLLRALIKLKSAGFNFEKKHNDKTPLEMTLCSGTYKMAAALILLGADITLPSIEEITKSSDIYP